MAARREFIAGAARPAQSQSIELHAKPARSSCSSPSIAGTKGLSRLVFRTGIASTPAARRQRKVSTMKILTTAFGLSSFLAILGGSSMMPAVASADPVERTYVACNQYGDCWRVHRRYATGPTRRSPVTIPIGADVPTKVTSMCTGGPTRKMTVGITSGMGVGTVIRARTPWRAGRRAPVSARQSGVL